ncbi:TPA: DNA polymerase III subunit gamma/tau [Candidatus Kaiserbacteria bacterium]|nr:MAG: polymerase III, subunit gamma and tau protein [Parcubacteria group bacterium GW2011_GWA1_56_13]KKW46232.1 MAG: polymerase III, subunit gamma and tau protein [Parcubacteria group bacterium GW2011_GWB1_57_6]HCR52682.1 DNA polymerase III subunit gamma/tau [Candidatus Kaiserbacteria bacterium]
MAHQALYRVYRPAAFSDVLGQEQVTKPLEEAAKSKKIGHAYLFAGSRGLGKTSVARIFAEAIGCKENDLYEIDAASNNSVEDIRALTEGVYTLPFRSPYKVYILDEAHMLSKSAWNAFLKTLEEPPAHAVFILATTELEKVPDTVQSRCQVFEFKKPTRAVLAKMTSVVAKKEGYALASDAAELIAILGDGSYRDALSVLQKVFAGAEGKALSREAVEAATGAPRREHVHALIAALARGERGKALAAIEQAAKADVDMRIFLELVLEALRATLLIRYAPELRASLADELGADEFSALEKFATSTPLSAGKEDPSTKLGAGGITHAAMLAFLTAAERIRYAPIPALPLELAVLELFADEKQK